PQPVAHDADALLQHAREEPHLALLLEDGYLAARGDGLARHEGVAETTPEGVAIGRAAAIAIPVHAYAPQARPINPLAALYGGIAVVGSVSIPSVRALRAQRHVARVFDRHAHFDGATEHYLLRVHLHLENVNRRLTAALYF